MATPRKRAPIDRFTRLVLMACTVAAGLCAVVLVRGVTSVGLFKSVDHAFNGSCRVIAGMQGPGAFEIDAADAAIFVAARNVRAANDARDGLYYLPLGDAAAKPVKLAGTPPDFHPGGLGLFRAPDGSVALMAANHRASGRNAVEIFNVTFAPGAAPKLAHVNTIGSGLLHDPGDIYAIAPDRFYIVNTHGRGRLPQWIEDFALLPRGSVLYFNGSGFNVAIDGLAMPSGIAASQVGTHLYVSSANGRKVAAYGRDLFNGNLSEAGALDVPARPGSLSVDVAGDLWVAAQPRLPGLSGFTSNPAKPSSSEVLRLRLGADGAPQLSDVVYVDPGAEIGAASVAASEGGHLYVGSWLDSKMLDCTFSGNK